MLANCICSQQKLPGAPATTVAILANCRDQHIKLPISGLLDIGNLISHHSPSVSTTVILCACRQLIQPIRLCSLAHGFTKWQSQQ